jgi:hypothetical protein
MNNQHHQILKWAEEQLESRGHLIEKKPEIF